MVSTMSPLYNLRWGDYLPNMLNVFEQLLRKEEYTDVTLWLDSGQMVVKCHKIILAACSTFFEDIFSSMKTKGHANVVLTDIKYTDVKPILEFIYKGEINVTQEELEGILKTANFLKIKGLIPEYNDKYDAKFEPQVNITTCEADSIAENPDNRAPCCSHKCDEKPPTEDLEKSAWPHQTDQDQSQYYSSDSSVESPSKKIKEEEPDIEESPIMKSLLDKNQRKHCNETRPRQSTTNSERPQRPKSNNSVNESVEHYRSDSNVLDDYSRNREQGSSKGQKKIVRQDSVSIAPAAKEWRKYKKYSPEELDAALQAMRMGLSPIAASKEFNIPSRTLYDKAKKLGIDTKDIRRNYNKSAAFPIGIGRNINNRIYRPFLENEYDNLTVNSSEGLFTETFERNEPPEIDAIELLTQLRPDLQIRPTTSLANFDNIAQDLSINSKQDTIPKT